LIAAHGRVADTAVRAALLSSERISAKRIKRLNLAKLNAQRSTFSGIWGGCNACGKMSSKRWDTPTSVNLTVALCWQCRDRYLTPDIDVVQSRSLRPGSYGTGYKR
jgi:hypothetical protein